jgi:hypothetical protein
MRREMTLARAVLTLPPARAARRTAKKTRQTLAKTNAKPRPYWVSALRRRSWSAKSRFPCHIDAGTSQFFETLILIGFALRYHSKRRESSGSTANGQPSVLCCRSGGDPEPQLLDGAARARIIGAFALFVST